MADTIKVVVVHWTGGGAVATSLDREHYNVIVEQNGSVVSGKHDFADQFVTSDGDYAAHTLNFNTAAASVALCGMAGATSPDDVGEYPITEPQWFSAVDQIAAICREYGVPVTPQTVLTHAEVEPNCGVKQRGKWDITVLPWEGPAGLRGARAVGDYLRSCVVEALGPNDRSRLVPVGPLRLGCRGPEVEALQTRLEALRFFCGRVDGVFGPLTRDAVVVFQTNNGLAPDGVVGPKTAAALEVAGPRPERAVTVDDLERSGTVADARATGRVGDLIGATAGGLATQLDTAADAVGTAGAAVDQAGGVLARLSDILANNWPLLLVIAVMLVAWFVLRTLGADTIKRRVRDAREGRNLAR